MTHTKAQIAVLVSRLSRLARDGHWISGSGVMT